MNKLSIVTGYGASLNLCSLRLSLFRCCPCECLRGSFDSPLPMVTSAPSARLLLGALCVVLLSVSFVAATTADEGPHKHKKAKAPTKVTTAPETDSEQERVKTTLRVFARPRAVTYGHGANFVGRVRSVPRVVKRGKFILPPPTGKVSLYDGRKANTSFASCPINKEGIFRCLDIKTLHYGHHKNITAKYSGQRMSLYPCSARRGRERERID